jgi:hypothetical protein
MHSHRLHVQLFLLVESPVDVPRPRDPAIRLFDLARVYLHGAMLISVRDAAYHRLLQVN